MTAYQDADQFGHAAAATNLGVLLEQQGDPATAEAYYRRADERGDPNGAFNLALALEKEGNQIGALRAYERADQLGPPPLADMARAAAQQIRDRVQTPTGVARGGAQNGS
jgi:TPR repeat protein